MKNEMIKTLLDAYVEKQRESYERTNNFDRCYHRFQGYVACLIDTGLITIDERSTALDYMTDKLEGVENN